MKAEVDYFLRSLSRCSEVKEVESEDVFDGEGRGLIYLSNPAHVEVYEEAVIVNFPKVRAEENVLAQKLSFATYGGGESLFHPGQEIILRGSEELFLWEEVGKRYMREVSIRAVADEWDSLG